MLNRKIYFFLLPLLVGFFAAQVVNADFGAPGSSTNPVISKSYADKLLLPLKEQVDALSREVSRLRETTGDPVFRDVPSGHWAYNYIGIMVEKDVIRGISAGYFGPDKPTRRSEFAVMIVKALNLPLEKKKMEFSDIPESHWAYSYIATAQKAGIISGYPDGKFKPDEYVTRGQMAVMLARAYSLERTGREADFRDVLPSYWAYDAILKLADNKITKGYEDKTFRPGLPVKRAEVAVFLAKAADTTLRDN